MFQSKRLHFLSRTSPNPFSRCILHINNSWKNVNFFDKNHALTPLEKCKFGFFVKTILFQPKGLHFLSRTSPNTFSRIWSILHINKRWKDVHLLSKTMDYPFWKNDNFAAFLNRCFCLENASFSFQTYTDPFYIKNYTWKNGNFFTKPMHVH